MAAVAEGAAVIRANTRPAAGAFAARLATKARALAEARIEDERRATAQDPWRWRAARLLWPLF
jgi:hypothetical protein